jgi:hypothetical protein
MVPVRGESMGRTLVLCVWAAALLVPGAVRAWESDMHYGLTKWLALQAGYREDAAEMIADRAESIDGHIVDAVHLMVWYACLESDKKTAKQASEMIRDHHFPTFEVVGQPPEKREVVPGSDAALAQARRLTGRPSTTLPYDTEKFGDSLHVVKDSWSHQGIPDVPQLLGLVKCDSDYAWGHPQQRGGWSRHNADITFVYPDHALKAAEITYGLLEKFLKLNPSLGTTGKPWPAIEPRVKQFIEAKTKTDKKKWFMAEGFKDFSFLYRISIPDGGESFLTMRTATRKIRDRALSTMAKIDVPKHIQEFYDKFFRDWAMSDDFVRIAQTYTDPAAVIASLQLSAATGPESIEGVATSLALWRLSDHGKFAAAGHRPGPTVASWSTAFIAFGGPGELARYETVQTAFVPISLGADRRVPYLVAPVPAGKGAERDLFVGLARFRHAPNDTLVVTVRDKGKPGVVSIQSVAEH